MRLIRRGRRWWSGAEVRGKIFSDGREAKGSFFWCSSLDASAEERGKDGHAAAYDTGANLGGARQYEEQLEFLLSRYSSRRTPPDPAKIYRILWEGENLPENIDWDAEPGLVFDF